MPSTPYDVARKSVEAPGPDGQLRLVAELASRLRGELNKPPRSLLELEGLGREIWQRLDVDEYLRGERSSWDG